MTKPRHFSFSFDEIGLTPTRVAHRMRHDPENPAGPFSELIEQVLESVPQYARIEGGYSICPNPVLNREEKTIDLESAHFDPKRIVFNQLRKAEQIAVFVCTAGPIGEWAASLMGQGDILKGYVVDTVGSETVEAAMDIIHDALEVEMRQMNFGITNRFSPGYCGWNVIEQHQLFSLLPPDFCGIRLRESGLMSPIKSVSGFIGIAGKAKRHPYTCNICDDEHCLYRKSSDVC